MLHAATIGVLLALAPQAQPAPPGRTLWIVQPLYPGQDMLVTRTEEALRRLIASSMDQLIGKQALSEHLAGRKADLGCLTGDSACADPVDAFVASLGLERVVMLKGGQEDAAYHYKATSYVPATGETVFAEGSGPALERALLAALVKVAPLASALEVTSDPPGATVFIDGEKVGVTPFSGQVLPGERTIKIEIASHMPAEKKFDVPVRGKLQFNQALEKVPARIVLTATPAGASISIDGVKQGQDKIDKPIQPGRHQLTFALEGYEPLSEEAVIEPGATFTAARSLAATGWTRFKASLHEAHENIYKRSASLTLSYEWTQLYGNKLYAQEDITKDTTNTKYLLAREVLAGSPLQGFSVGYDVDFKYFGFLAAGAAWYTSGTWTYSLEHGQLAEGQAKPMLFVLRGLQPHLRIAFWHFVFSGQAGFEARALVLQPITGTPDYDNKTIWFLDAQLSAQLGLRAYIVEGLYVGGAYRFGWTFSSHAGDRGFNAGVGYAF